MLFEFLTGIPPFNDDTPEQIFKNILNRGFLIYIYFYLFFFIDIPWPEPPLELSPPAKDLIDKLLTLDPQKRLGYKSNK